MGRYEFIAVYIMASQRNGTISVGVTSDLLQRGLAHREGRVEGFTTRYGCKLLVWCSMATCRPRSRARKS